jgi:hypothetical protein
MRRLFILLITVVFMFSSSGIVVAQSSNSKTKNQSQQDDKGAKKEIVADTQPATSINQSSPQRLKEFEIKVLSTGYVIWDKFEYGQEIRNDASLESRPSGCGIEVEIRNTSDVPSKMIINRKEIKLVEKKNEERSYNFNETKVRNLFALERLAKYAQKGLQKDIRQSTSYDNKLRGVRTALLDKNDGIIFSYIIYFDGLMLEAFDDKGVGIGSLAPADNGFVLEIQGKKTIALNLVFDAKAQGPSLLKWPGLKPFNVTLDSCKLPSQ